MTTYRVINKHIITGIDNWEEMKKEKEVIAYHLLDDSILSKWYQQEQEEKINMMVAEDKW